MTLEEIFEENAAYVWRVLRRLGVGEADVEDVCQEVFLTVHRKLDTFDGSSALRTWLYGICLRLASEYRQRRRRRQLPHRGRLVGREWRQLRHRGRLVGREWRFRLDRERLRAGDGRRDRALQE
ncbi:sigma-70 family RNA polymerase sigma factor [Sorangium sp. So ce295]|uniref:RNA polymerase sigma factor n=1 Tax=Sorangium sp. So ce295 TaxID=3133295 RepID=UPI003F62BD77